jgi:hypothetical protein
MSDIKLESNVVNFSSAFSVRAFYNHQEHKIPILIEIRRGAKENCILLTSINGKHIQAAGYLIGGALFRLVEKFLPLGASIIFPHWIQLSIDGNVIATEVTEELYRVEEIMTKTNYYPDDYVRNKLSLNLNGKTYATNFGNDVEESFTELVELVRREADIRPQVCMCCHYAGFYGNGIICLRDLPIDTFKEIKARGKHVDPDKIYSQGYSHVEYLHSCVSFEDKPT